MLGPSYWGRKISIALPGCKRLTSMQTGDLQAETPHVSSVIQLSDKYPVPAWLLPMQAMLNSCKPWSRSCSLGAFAGSEAPYWTSRVVLKFRPQHGCRQCTET